MTPYDELALALSHLARAGAGITALGLGPQGAYISSVALSLDRWATAQGLTDDDDGEPDEGEAPDPRDVPRGAMREPRSDGPVRCRLA